MYSKVTHHLKCLAVLPCHLPLITIHISGYRQFSDIHISQGSVATYLRCGGIFKYDFIANLPLSLSVNEFWKSVNIWRSYGQEFSVLFFLTHGVELQNWTEYGFTSRLDLNWGDPAGHLRSGTSYLRSTTSNNRSCTPHFRSGTFLLGSTTLHSLYLSIFQYACCFVQM